MRQYTKPFGSNNVLSPPVPSLSPPVPSQYKKNYAGLSLTRLPLVPHIWVSESGQHCFRKWLAAYSEPSHYLNQCRFVVNWTIRTNFSEILIKIQNFSFTKMHLKISSAKWRQFCPGGDEFIEPITNLGETSKIQTFSLKKMYFKMSSAKRRPCIRFRHIRDTAG